MSERVYSDEIREEILRRLEEGKSLREACEGPDKPTPAAVLKWCHYDEEFARRYNVARMIGYQLQADDMITIAKGPGEGDSAVRVARDRLKVDTGKWILAKMLPKMYGDKVINEHTGTDGEPLTVRVVHEVVDPRSEGN